jgi:hypothetical protein
MELKRVAAGVALMLVIGVSQPVLAEGLGRA